MEAAMMTIGAAATTSPILPNNSIRLPKSSGSALRPCRLGISLLFRGTIRPAPGYRTTALGCASDISAEEQRLLPPPLPLRRAHHQHIRERTVRNHIYYLSEPASCQSVVTHRHAMRGSAQAQGHAMREPPNAMPNYPPPPPPPPAGSAVASEGHFAAETLRHSAKLTRASCGANTTPECLRRRDSRKSNETATPAAPKQRGSVRVMCQCIACPLSLVGYPMCL